ncbi:MAG: SfiI family type II restriction endonuclease [Acidobacteriaceae bacterium]
MHEIQLNGVTLKLDDIEDIERLSLRASWQGLLDFGFDAWEVFRQSTDDPKDVAEDCTREMLDRFGGYGVVQRVYGNVDYRKARHIVLPDYAIRQALFVDSKAEKSNATATLQMSQLSMRVRHVRGGESLDMPGRLKCIETYDGVEYLSTTLLMHYCYSSAVQDQGRDVPPYRLGQVKLAAIPNGFLQDRYNPHEGTGFWRAGRNAPSLDEEFRVRISFEALSAQCRWRVQTAVYDEEQHRIIGQWTK